MYEPKYARRGLLPNPNGQEDMPSITPEVRKLSASVSKEGLISKIIIKREWEK